MSNTKKSKKHAYTEAGVATLEPGAEAALLSHIGAAASELLLKETTTAPPEIEPQRETPPEAVGESVWQRGRKFTALWGTNEDRNSWVAVQGIGWKKLSTASDSANVALTVLATHALQTARTVDYREESDGMIHEIYVW